MKPKLLITGGAGFIGTAVADRVADTFQTYLLDSLHPQVHPAHTYIPAATTVFLPGDLTSVETVRAALDYARPDYVLHLAAETGTGQSCSEAARHASVNVLGTAVLTDALLRSGRTPQRLVHASTRAVYGEGAWLDGATGEPCYPAARAPGRMEAGDWRVFTPEGVPAAHFLPHRAGTVEPRPTSVYGVTKLAQEGVLRCYANAYGSDLTTLRFQNVYGPGQSLTNSYTGVLVHFAKLAARGEAIPIFEDGEIVRDFVYIQDVAEALFLALTTGSAGDVPLDIGSGSPVTLAGVGAMMASYFGAPAPVITGQYRAGDVRAAHADPRPAREALGFHAETALESGIAELGAWLQSLHVVWSETSPIWTRPGRQRAGSAVDRWSWET